MGSRYLYGITASRYAWRRNPCPALTKQGKSLPCAGIITSKLTSKAQTTIPQPVRIALGLHAGDEIAYVIEGGKAVLTRYGAQPAGDDPFAAFPEWGSDADSEAYGKL
jgi:antitoxin PrlF